MTPEVNRPLQDLLDWINGDRQFAWAQPNKWLADALATERRLTVERIRAEVDGRTWDDDTLERLVYILEQVAAPPSEKVAR